MKLLFIFLFPVFLFADGEPGTWFQISTGDAAFDYFFSLIFSFGLVIFAVVSIFSALVGRK